MLIRDLLGRPLRELRISVTDRCNFRCTYCMPRSVYGPGYQFMPSSAMLDFDEIEMAANAFVSLGVRKIRLTGGEPLMRKGLEKLVARLARLRTPEGGKIDLAMTTNGSLLARKAVALREAGLHRITVSIDALSESVFRRMSDADCSAAEVFDGVAAAHEAGFGLIKLNMVVKRGTNEDEIVPLARYVRESFGHKAELRFIEYMDVGECNRWRSDEVLPSQEVIRRLQEHFPMEALGFEAPSTSTRWRYTDGAGEVGVISSVTQPFCGDCTRARLSADGRLFTCLFAERGRDLLATLRGPHEDPETRMQALRTAITDGWRPRADRYSEGRSTAVAMPTRKRVEMHYIGG